MNSKSTNSLKAGNSTFSIKTKSYQQVETDMQPLNFDIDLLDLELDKIRLFISILEEHELKCEKDERFPEAGNARNKINLLKEVEEAKIIRDLKEMQNEQLIDIQTDHHNEISDLIANFNQRNEELKANCNIMLQHLKEKQEKEKALILGSFEENYPSQPKFSPEVLNLQKKMEAYAKNKEYEKANEVKIKIIQLCSHQEEKWKTEDYRKKLSCEDKKINAKHNKELEKLKLKIQRTIDEYEKVHKEELKTLELRYKNKLKGVLSEHILNENNFKRPSKYQIIKRVGI